VRSTTTTLTHTHARDSMSAWAWVLCIFIVGIVRFSHGCERNSINVNTLEERTLYRPSDDAIEVFFLRAPLLETMLGSTLQDIGGFHSAVGMRSSKDGSLWSFEYDAKEFTGALLPKIVNGTLVWYTGAEVCYEGHLEADLRRRTYWTMSTLVSRITGKQYNALVDHILGFGKDIPSYQALNVFDVSVDPPVLRNQSSTCSDFVWNVLGHLKHNIGADLDPVVAPRTSSFALLADAKQKSIVTGLSSEVVDFYRAIDDVTRDISARKLHFGDIMRAVREIDARIFYVYLGNDMYMKVPLRTRLGLAIFVYAPPDLFAAGVLTYPSMRSVIKSPTWAGNFSNIRQGES